ncbi:MAG: hypothetical protein LUG16_01035 [Candidatus Gastranaerophilales bacterium]|nr:hypothetical protein [Candidatus Gastranaerophilales bacterium]
MYILPSTKISDIETKGTDNQKAAATYFDKNGNGIIDKNEADSFNLSKISKTDEALTITSPNGYIDKFENISIKRSDDYYKSGYIPVAVVDDFTTNGGIQHGTGVCNIIKSINPNISLTKINCCNIENWNGLQKFADKVICKFPKLENALYSNKTTGNLCNDFFGSLNFEAKTFEIAYKKLKEQIDSGVKFEAVNMSQAIECQYSTINSLVSDELGVEITPDNIADYKKEIKEILRQKQTQKIEYEDMKPYSHKGKISDILRIIDAMESVKIPIYNAGAYKSPDNTETFSLLSLADNSLTVEAGIETENGIIHADVVSHNSFALDENGKRRIADSIVYGAGELQRGSTSFATPMVLANSIKEKYK